MSLSNKITIYSQKEAQNLVADFPMTIKPSQHEPLLKYISTKQDYPGVAALFGLKGTGKKTWIRHCAAETPNSYLLHINSATMYDIYELMNKFIAEGKKTYFIENITDVPDFMEHSRQLYKTFARMGNKIILSGDNTYVFHLCLWSSLACSLTLYRTEHMFNTDTDVVAILAENAAFAVKNRQYEEYTEEFYDIKEYVNEGSLEEIIRTYFTNRENLAIKKFLINSGLIHIVQGKTVSSYPEFSFD